jgi:hypothetical protein
LGGEGWMEKIVLGSFFPSKITVGSRIIYTFYYFPGLFSIDLLSFIPKEKNDFTFLTGFTGKRKYAIKNGLRL